MAKRRTTPARMPGNPTGDEHSLLLRSAESLGRIIGTLQRQLDSATRRLSIHDNGGNGKGPNGKRPSDKKKNRKSGKQAGAKKTVGVRTSKSATSVASEARSKRKRPSPHPTSRDPKSPSA